MDDPILTSRVEALRNILKVVSANLESRVWQTEHDPQGGRAELLGESSLWIGLDTTLIREITKHVATLDRVAAGLAEAAEGDQTAAAKAWDGYARTLRDSKDLLRECLEIIGTLAIRTKDLDNRILYVADELIRDCMTLSTGDLQYYLLVHGLGDTFSKTRARIIRLRFPEWTIWDLPLAAHELGRVAVAEILEREKQEDDPSLQTLTTFVAKQREALLAVDTELDNASRAGGDAATEATRWAQNRVRVLLADAFATYTMGPAYACSAIMLRLNPSVIAERDLPSDSQRAHVILSMLGAMNKKVAIVQPYRDVISKLEEAWKNMVGRSNPTAALSSGYATSLGQMAETFIGEVTYLILNGTAGYPAGSPQRAGGDGWQKAQEWAGAWMDQWMKKQPLATPTDGGGKLRDVLNATWLCRLALRGAPEEMIRAHRDLAATAQSLCKAIIGARSAGTGPRRNP